MQRLQEAFAQADDTFAQDAGWYAAAKRYDDFVCRHKDRLVRYLELGVGMNTPMFCSLRTRQKVRKSTVKQQIADGSHINNVRKYEERRCA